MLANNRLLSSLSRLLFASLSSLCRWHRDSRTWRSSKGKTLLFIKSGYPTPRPGKPPSVICGFTRFKFPTGAWAEKLYADFGTLADFALSQVQCWKMCPRIIRGW